MGWFILTSCSDLKSARENNTVNLQIPDTEDPIVKKSIEPPVLKTIDNSKCNPPNGWKEIYDTAPRGIFLFGEWHGTQEAPDLVVEYACAIAEATGEKTLVLFEAEFWQHSAFNELLQAPASEAETILREGLCWQK